MISLSDIPAKVAFLRGLAPAGFVVALHARFQTPTYLFQTYPSEWITEYGRDGLMMHDPTVAWALTHSGARPWSEAAAEDSAGMMARAARHGLNYGVTISLESGGSRSIGNFARSDREFTPEEIESIYAAVAELHEATASAQPLPAETREGLRRLSVAYTQP